MPMPSSAHRLIASMAWNCPQYLLANEIQSGHGCALRQPVGG